MPAQRPLSDVPKGKQMRLTATWSNALFLSVAASVAVLWHMGGWLVVPERVTAVPDAILILGSHEYERMPRGVRAAADYPDAYVILSRPARPSLYNCHDCEYRVQRLVAHSVPLSRTLVMDTPVRNTFEELDAAARLARAHGWKHVLVVASAYSTRRVMGLARLVEQHHGGPRFQVVSAPNPGVRPGRWWTRPYDREYVIYEVAALAANSQRHRVWPWFWLD